MHSRSVLCIVGTITFSVCMYVLPMDHLITALSGWDLNPQPVASQSVALLFNSQPPIVPRDCHGLYEVAQH